MRVRIVAVGLAVVATACASPPDAPDTRPIPAASTVTVPTPSPTGAASTAPSEAPTTPRPTEPSFAEAPSIVQGREPLPACGWELVERTAQGDIYDAAVRECFLEAYGTGEPAEMITTGPTVEGAPVTAIIRHLASGLVEVFYDATADPFGSQDWTRFECDTITPLGEDAVGTPLFVWDECSEPQPLS